MTENFSPFDFAEALDSAEAIEIFLADAFDTQDMAHIAAALAIVARAEGLVELTETTALTREQISHALSAPDNLTSETTLKVLSSIGLTLPQARQKLNASS